LGEHLSAIIPCHVNPADGVTAKVIVTSRSRCVLGARFLTPDIEGLRPDVAVVRGCQLMSAGTEVTVNEGVGGKKVLGMPGRFEPLRLCCMDPLLVAGERMAKPLPSLDSSALPFKYHGEHRHHIPKPRYRVTNWAEYDASLRKRGSLTVWVTDEAIAAWRAEPRPTPGGQPHYSALAISTALTLRAAFGLALRQTEGLIGSVIALLGLDLAVPDHSTLSRRAKTLEVPPFRQAATGPLHLLVDSTGLKLGGAGEWLFEKHGTSRRRSWRKLHIGIDAASGEIVAVKVTKKEVDDGAVVDALLDQIVDPIASFTADGDYDQDRVSQAVAERYPDAAVIVPPRAGAVVSASAETAPTQRDRHLQMTAKRGGMAWQKASGYNLRAKVETSIGRYKRMIGDALRSRTDQTEATEVAVAVAALNRMLGLGRPNCARIV
jgi:hypothetical protein